MGRSYYCWTELNQTRYHNDVNEIDTDNTHGDADNSITASVGPQWPDPKYDAAGNMTLLPHNGTSYSFLYYDAWNRLVEYDDAVDDFEYDGLHRRIVRTGTGSPRDYYYNEDWQLLEERVNSSTNPESQFVWHPYYIDALAVRYWDGNTDGDFNETNEGAHYFCQDANFNVTAVVNASGTVLERYQYTPYGEVTFLEDDFDVRTTQQTTIGNRHLYTGRERDPNSKLQLNRNRYYCGWLGRWLTRDPIGYEGGMNLYWYMTGRPTYYVDPTGFQQLWPGQVPEPGQPIPPGWYPPQPAPPPPPPATGFPSLYCHYLTHPPIPDCVKDAVSDCLGPSALARFVGCAPCIACAWAGPGAAPCFKACFYICNISATSAAIGCLVGKIDEYCF